MFSSEIFPVYLLVENCWSILVEEDDVRRGLQIHGEEGVRVKNHITSKDDQLIKYSWKLHLTVTKIEN